MASIPEWQSYALSKYHKIKKAVQQERQHQSSAAAQDTQQEAGNGDKQRISHAAAPSIACQQERNGQQ